MQPSRDLILRLRKRDLFVCASETILDPNQSKKIGTDSKKIINEIIKLRNKKYYVFECEKSDKIKNKNNLNISIELRKQIEIIQNTDIFCRIFKIGFGNGNKNPVTDSTSFFKPNKEDFNDKNGVTYTSGIVQSSKYYVIKLNKIEFYVLLLSLIFTLSSQSLLLFFLLFHYSCFLFSHFFNYLLFLFCRELQSVASFRVRRMLFTIIL